MTRLYLTLAAAAACAGCAFVPASTARHCDVTSIEEVYANPVQYFGKTFCGNVFVLLEQPEIFVVPSRNWKPSLDEFVLIVDSVSNDEIAEIMDKRSSVQVRLAGEIDGDLPCFEEKSIKDEKFSCAPFRFPAIIKVTYVHELK